MQANTYHVYLRGREAPVEVEATDLVKPGEVEEEWWILLVQVPDETGVKGIEVGRFLHSQVEAIVTRDSSIFDSFWKVIRSK